VAPTSFVESGFLFLYGQSHILCRRFNLYHALDRTDSRSDPHAFRRYKWLNLWKFSSLFVGPRDSLERVLLFTAFVTWDPQKVARHMLLIRANENAGVSVVYGEFKRKDKKCRLCHKLFQTFEEKQTDVNIALELFRLAYLGQYDRAVIISGDTDLIPAIKAVRSTFPQKQIGVMIPIGKSSEDILKQADFRFKMKESHLISSRFENTLRFPDNSTIECPLSWR
jgi:uncharacterized LabA/DUF88 family protein